MRPEPRDDPAPSEPEGTEDDEGSAHPSPGQRVEDDGTVPEKQISRWKNEGGSWHPWE
jgi:hypothetical protein